MSNGGASRTAPSVATAEFIRSSDEYNVAFDLEIWKAQQQASFRQQLRQAKEALEKKVLHELKAAHARKVEELEARRQQLEVMATRVQAAGEALEKRSEQFQAREQAFEARRVRVAEQHESHLQRVETRNKQATETLATQLEAARVELSEKDGIIRDVRSRLLTAENEYDALLRRLARFGAGDSATAATGGGTSSSSAGGDTGASPSLAPPDQTKIRALEAELGAANRTVQEQRAQLAQQQTEMERLARENATQVVALRKAEASVDALTRRCARVQDDYYARERDHLQRERDQLEAQKRAETRSARHRHLLLTSGLTAPPPSYHVSGGGSGGVGHPAVAVSGFSTHGPVSVAERRSEDGLGEMLQELRSDIQHVLTTGSQAAQRTSYIIAEPQRPPSRTTGCSTTASVLRSGAPAVPGQGRHAPVESIARDAAVQVGAVPRDANQSVTDSLASLPQHRHDNNAAHYDEDGDDVDVDEYAHVNINSWLPQSNEVSGLPPLRPPSVHDVYGREEESPYNGPESSIQAPPPPASSSALALPPEDFARAVGSLPGGDATTTKTDMQTFVQQMKINRQKLLETGVYTESHAVIREMNDKIRIYEDFLRSQFA